MSFANNYNFVDRALHYLAFSTPFVQKMLGELENDLYRSQLAQVESRREVFVTGLPRAGTTLVLELLYGTGEFRTFTYRDMPFILAPLLWRKVSKSFQKKATKSERAHGDGMQVSFDSPEAFEEIIWLAYLRDKIEHPKFLSPLSAGDCTEEFGTAMRAAVRKLLLPPDDEEVAAPGFRYLSKNNANVSRIDAIAKLFPTSTILVPFRDPLTHVASLHRQHERFLVQHREDAFSRRYMSWLGHFEFGDNMKPINFGDWLNCGEVPSPVNEEFWMRYWVATYAHALKHKRDNVYFIDFDGMLREARDCLERIGSCVGIVHRETLVDAAATLRLPTTESVDVTTCSAETWRTAQEVHAQLRRLAV
jgi:Sulfotransferase family